MKRRTFVISGSIYVECASCHPANSAKALKEAQSTDLNQGELSKVKVKVKVGFLYSATYTANQNSALHNLGIGS